MHSSNSRPTSRSSTSLAILLGACLGLGAILAAPASAQERAGPGTVRLLVTFVAPGPDLSPLERALRAGAAPTEVRDLVGGLAAAARLQRAEFALDVERLGGSVTAVYWLVDACAVEIPAGQEGVLRAREDLRTVAPDAWHRPTSLTARAPLGRAPAPIQVSTDAQNHNADKLQALGFKGQGATLACLDSGQDDPLLGTVRPHRIYFVDGDPTNTSGGGLAGSRLLANVQVGAMPPDDGTGHGTAMAAIAAGGDWATAGADHGHAPHAGIVGYSIADNAAGMAQSSTLIAAWQRVVADQATYGIGVVQNPYDGSPDPLDPVQQALDRAAVVADLLITVPAGNGGASTAQSQSAANGIAVAACAPSRAIAQTSSRGPLQGDPGRTFPDITANGVKIVTAEHDNEAVDRVESGTSPACAQVAGAALLYRSLKPGASALETKAAILAATEDISAKNPAAPFNSPNAYGMGYLRDDLLADVALGKGFVASGTLTFTKRSLTYRVAASPGVQYSAVLAWHRHVTTSAGWSDFDLTVRSGGMVVAQSASKRNLYEKVTFTAPGPLLELVVQGTGLECPGIDFTLVAPKAAAGTSPIVQSTFGPGCKGNCPSVNPQGDKLLGSVVTVPTTYAIEAVTTAPVTTAGFWICAQSTAGTSIAASLWTSVLAGTMLVPGTMIDSGTITIPADTTPAWHQVAFSSTQTLAGSTTYMVQLTANNQMVLPELTAGPFVNHVRWNTATTSWVPGTGRWAFRLYCPDATGDVEIGFLDLPYLGRTFTVTLDWAKARSPVALTLGFSETFTLGGIPLPLPLAVIGAPSCTLYTSPDFDLPAITSPSGQASLSIPLPPNPALAGVVFYNQWICLDPGANRLGVVTTTSLKCRVGG